MATTKIKNLAEGNVLSGLLRLAFPLMGTSFLQMAYALLTMAWVGRLHSDAGNYNNAIGAIGILLWLTSAIALLGMIGAEVSVGQSIGAKKLNRARVFASHSATVAFTLSIVWATFVFIKAPFLLSFHHLEAEIASQAIIFLRILVLIFPFQFLTYTFIGVYNGSGRSSVPFKYNAIGLIINMIIDPLLMFETELSNGWHLGFGLGFYGAAIGTVFAQFCVFILFMVRMKVKQGIIGSYPFFVRPKLIYLKRILFLGFPVSITSALFAIINFTLAGIASKYDPNTGVTSQTTGGQIEGVTWNTAQGFSTALSAFVAQNYAAKKIERGLQAYIYTLKILGLVGLIVSILFMFFGDVIFGIIVPKETAITAGAKYLFVMGTVQIFLMLEVTSQGMFNGIGRTIEPAIISITFNFLRIPLAIFIASRLSPDDAIMGVWWSIAISTVCKGIIMPGWFYVLYKRIQKKEAMRKQG